MSVASAAAAPPSSVALMPLLRDSHGDLSHVGLVRGERWELLSGVPQAGEDGPMAAARLAAAADSSLPAPSGGPVPYGAAGEAFPLETSVVAMPDGASSPFTWHRVLDLPALSELGESVAPAVGFQIATDELHRQPAQPFASRITAAYESVSHRGVSHNTLMWQTPGLSVTAQAFLLTIALDADTSAAGRMLAAGVSCVLAVLSIQLMRKHSEHEHLDRLFLERLEALASWPPGHRRPARSASPFLQLRSRDLWTFALALLGVVALAVFVLAALGSTLLDG